MYHNICAGTRTYNDLSPSATSYFVTESDFDAQLSALSSSGVVRMTWDDVKAFYGHAGQGGAPRSNCPATLLTFDDGWRDCVNLGGPALERHATQGVLFITTGFLGRPHFLSRDDVSRIDRSRFRVGSHARTHRMLSLLSEPAIRSELCDSKKLLEDLVGYEIDAVSIPSGAIDQRVRRIAAECGYRFVCDSEVRVNRLGDSPSAIARVAVTRYTSLRTFQRYSEGRLTRERVRRAVLSAPKRVLGLRRYENLRRRLLGEKRGQKVTHET
jgi:peptidoglycan/xylan/chitin deacetylase (PgdA/CDA1 family)